MLNRLLVLVPIFLVTQAGAVHWVSGIERPPVPPSFETFPAQVGVWKQFREDPVSRDVASELHADRMLSRIYSNDQGMQAGLFVAWFQSQRGGLSQPHSPKVCLPAAGWNPISTGELVLNSTLGSITVNRYLVAAGGQRAMVLYWYQARQHVAAGEWAAKFWTIADGVRDRRTDIALVRILVWAESRTDEASLATASSFARSIYPVLVQAFPR